MTSYIFKLKIDSVGCIYILMEILHKHTYETLAIKEKEAINLRGEHRKDWKKVKGSILQLV